MQSERSLPRGDNDFNKQPSVQTLNAGKGAFEILKYIIIQYRYKTRLKLIMPTNEFSKVPLSITFQ